ncbi:MFS transporter [Nonomuraea sp. NPDC050556]|uniref:MFS transporter n=1 Tax=Nonomuraea sp. NPDC050556 TaxID=3364369 RepID=UPI003788FC79
MRRDFALLWSAQTTSVLGNEISMMAIPLVAGLVLNASPFEMGVLAAAGKLPVLFVSLPAGALVDRWRKRRVMVATLLVAGTAMLTVPVGAVAGTLTMTQLYAVAMIVGICETIYNPAFQSYPLFLLGPERLMDGNAKLSTSGTAASTIGPGVGGFLVGLAGPAKAVLADALSYFAAALMIGLIRKPETSERRRSLKTDMKDGLRYVVSHPVLRWITLQSAIVSFLLAGSIALYRVYAVKELHWSPVAFGVVMGVSSLGGVLGGLVARRLTDRFGMTRVMLWASLCFVIGELPLPLVSPGLAGQVIVGLAWTFLLVGALVFNVTQRSYRQLVTPKELQGRLAATTRFLTWGATPLGALLAGAVAEFAGMRLTLLFEAVGLLLGPVVLWLSPLRTAQPQQPGDHHETPQRA